MAFKSFKRYIGMKEPPAKASGRRPPAAGKATAEVNPAEFANLVISMSRFLTRLDAQPALAKEKLGVAEWVALTVLSQSRKLSDRQLAKSLGVPGRRMREIITTLQRSGRVSHSQPNAEGLRFVELTDQGSASLDKANGELMTSLETVLKGRERLLGIANKQIRLLSRVTAAKAAS